MKKLENLKNEGNAFFKSSKYQEACEKYYEVLNELDYLAREQDLNDNLKDIESLENTCRLNVATCKLKTNDNDLAINECLKILKRNSTNIKAHYKAGCGYINKKNYEKALYHFEKVKEINPQEEIEQSNQFNELEKFFILISENFYFKFFFFKVKIVFLVKSYINDCKKYLKPLEESNKTDSKKDNCNLQTKALNDDKNVIEEKNDTSKISNLFSFF